MHEYSEFSHRWEPPIEDHSGQRFRKEFNHDLSVGIWNATAFFGLDPVKSKMRQNCDRPRQPRHLYNRIDLLGGPVMRRRRLSIRIF